ncbi:hypothetical protein PR202_ga13881 [Eleusine coracana subsp. coracana]|uniref:SAM-dependent methyltransferase Erg6/SMT-type domain-containing protein n=1 Tax=Eleusine coracana subsp. coracana TaxID=191504 RepID=A0AAV5CFZ7_ELECO|nr:hypothetical protein PR202_ga13881 [Eleusine coracana subsp. coracana]
MATIAAAAAAASDALQRCGGDGDGLLASPLGGSGSGSDWCGARKNREQVRVIYRLRIYDLPKESAIVVVIFCVDRSGLPRPTFAFAGLGTRKKTICYSTYASNVQTLLFDRVIDGQEGGYGSCFWTGRETRQAPSGFGRRPVNKYYDLVTSFYEYGWGDSFHFAGRWHGETLRESIKRHQHFMTLQLGLKEGMKVLDVGCGIGGPLVEIARFSLTDVSLPCLLQLGVYREVYRVLKPGQYFALDEWCLTDRFDSNNARHRTIKAEIELGDGLPDIRTTRQCIQAMKDAGFEVVYLYHHPFELCTDKDLCQSKSNAEIILLLFVVQGRLCEGSRYRFSLSMVSTLEFLRIAPAGSMRVYNFLRTASEGLLNGGREGIFTANFFILGRKPALETGRANGDL